MCAECAQNVRKVRRQWH